MNISTELDHMFYSFFYTYRWRNYLFSKQTDNKYNFYKNFLGVSLLLYIQQQQYIFVPKKY